MGLFSRYSDTDACAFLDQQHNEVDELFSKCEAAGAGEGGRRIFEQIRDKLRVHAQIEEELFYPPLKNAKSDETGEEIAEAVEEHYQIKLIINDIDTTKPRGDVFKGKMKCLKEDVQHHVKEERDTVFPDARKYLGEERLEALAEELRARAEELKKGGTRKSANPSANSGMPPKAHKTAKPTRRTAVRQKSAVKTGAKPKPAARAKARR